MIMNTDIQYVNRSQWQKLTAVVLLAEHVITQLTPDIPMSTNKFTIAKRYTNVSLILSLLQYIVVHIFSVCEESNII